MEAKHRQQKATDQAGYWWEPQTECSAGCLSRWDTLHADFNHEGGGWVREGGGDGGMLVISLVWSECTCLPGWCVLVLSEQQGWRRLVLKVQCFLDPRWCWQSDWTKSAALFVCGRANEMWSVTVAELYRCMPPPAYGHVAVVLQAEFNQLVMNLLSQL